jgi:PAS domain S-box-containing protein
VVSWNTGAERIKGYAPEEIIGQSFARFCTPEDAARGLPAYGLEQAVVQGHYRSVGWRVRRDGSRFWADALLTPVYAETGELAGFAKVTRDLTERKHMEDALEQSREQLRQLSAHVEAAREDERARLAREIHDELGGTLTGLKMDVAQLRRTSAGRDPRAAQKLESFARAIDDAVQTVRRLASELRPPVLDDFGLLAAMEWQLREFEQRSGIACQWRSAVSEVVLSRDDATAVFRVFQESLTNVARHAEATQVTVAVETHAQALKLTISDNGRGIRPEEIVGRGSLGLVGMRERVRLLAGELRIEGREGEGTTVEVSVPLGAKSSP